LATWVWSKVEVSSASKHKPKVAPEHHSAIVYGTKMYIFGENSQDLESFDFETKTWEICPAKGGVKPLPRQLHEAWLLGSRMYLFGGRMIDGSFAGAYPSDLWFYDFETESWEEVTETHAACGLAETQACILGAGKTDVVVTFCG
jgi:hypothetical protein